MKKMKKNDKANDYNDLSINNIGMLTGAANMIGSGHWPKTPFTACCVIPQNFMFAAVNDRRCAYHKVIGVQIVAVCPIAWISVDGGTTHRPKARYFMVSNSHNY